MNWRYWFTFFAWQWLIGAFAWVTGRLLGVLR